MTTGDSDLASDDGFDVATQWRNGKGVAIAPHMYARFEAAVVNPSQWIQR